MKPLKLCLVILLFVTGSALASSDDKTAQDKAGIKKTITSYVDAFNKGDAKALAAHWTEDGSLITPSEEEFIGRDKLEAGFKTYFKENKGIELTVTPVAIYVESPTEAIEEGVAFVTPPGGEPEQTRYVAKYVKQNGAWKIVKLREVFMMGESPGSEKMSELEWMVGDWVDEDHSGRLETTCYWSANGNFLVRSFQLSIEGEPAFGGKQIIGWDPSAKRIRSWVFDSNGGFGEGVWSKKDNKWLVSNTIVLNTGEKASSTNIFTPTDDDSYTWQSTNRSVGGELLPNTQKVTVVRLKSDTGQDASGKK